MGILSEYNLNDLPEVGPVAPGEYEVMITKAEDYIGKDSGKPSIRIIFDIPNELSADSIFYYLGLPNSNDTEKQKINKLRRIKEFLAAFDLDQNSAYNEWVGRKAWALINQEPDIHGEIRNSIRRFIGSSGSSSETPIPTLGSEDVPF